MSLIPCDKHEITNCDYCKPKPKKHQPSGVWAHKGVVVVVAKYPGKCMCGDYYDEGEKIAKRDGDESWMHEDCL